MSSMKRRFKSMGLLFGLVAVVGMLTIALAACSDDEEEAPARVATAPARVATAPAAPVSKYEPVSGAALVKKDSNAKYGGVMRLSCNPEPSHFDMIQAGGTTNAHPGMAYNANVVRLSPVDPEHFIPDLAEGWNVYEGGKVWDFTLKTGLRAHDGSSFDAEDVKATFDRIIFPPEGVASLRKTHFQGTNRIEVLDTHKVRFVLDEPKGLFLGLLAFGWNGISSKDFLEANDYNLRRVKDQPGMGPFKFVKHVELEYWEFERFEGYHVEGLPYLDTFECVKIGSGPSSQVTAGMYAGQIDSNINTAAELVNDIDAGNLPQFTYITHGSSYHPYVIVNLEKEGPWQDKRVRRAMHLAIDRQALVEAQSRFAFYGVGAYAPPLSRSGRAQDDILNMPGYRSDKTEDLATAKALMAEAGYPDGFSLDWMQSGTDERARIRTAAIEDMFGTLGITFESTRAFGSSESWDALLKGDFTVGNGGVGFNVDDAQDMLEVIVNPDSPSNYGKYNSPEANALLKELNSTFGFAERRALGLQIMDIIEEDAPYLPDIYHNVKFVYAKFLEGIPNLPLGQYIQGRWDTVWVNK